MKEYKSKLDRISLVREKTEIPRVKIKSSRDASEYCRNFFGSDIDLYESFFMVLLNQANNTTGFVKISQGGIAGTVVDVRILAKYAIESLCTSVILCHNHPSGNTKPSGADISITKKAIEALKLFDITVLDHIILTESSYLSFGDEGLI